MKNKVFEEYKDKHSGERVFLIANGPSLKDINLDLLKNETCIAMNRISLIYDKFSKWKPTYYLFSSTNVKHPTWGYAWTKSVRQAVSEPSTTSFIAKVFKEYVDPKHEFKNVNWFESMSEHKPEPDGSILESCFSTDIVDRIDKSGTTMNLALQIVHHMNFSEVIFVGADLGWTGDRGTKNDPNHFDSSYQADIPPEKVDKINNQMRNVHSLAFKKLREKNSNIKIYNASFKTCLDVYPIIDFNEYILNNKVKMDYNKMRKASEFWASPAQYSMNT